MTPFEEAGFKPEDFFLYKDLETMVFKLNNDDGTNAPNFIKVNDTQTFWIHLHNLKKLTLVELNKRPSS